MFSGKDSFLFQGIECHGGGGGGGDGGDGGCGEVVMVVMAEVTI